MKASFYNLHFDYKGRKFIYNTLSTSLIAIDEKTSENLEKSKVELIDKDTLCQLEKQGMVVDNNLDETVVYETFYNEMQYCGIKDELRLVFIPTYSCNLKCVYCFEVCSTCKPINLTGIDQIVKFIQRQLAANLRYRKLSIVLFGGEPLICVNECIYLCKSLSLLAQQNGIEFVTKISTNSLLITPDVIKKLFIPYKMRIQITLDGGKAYHNKRRVYRDGKGTYSQILDSIRLLNYYGIKNEIDLRINVDKNNIESVEEVLNDVHGKVGYVYIGLLRAVGNNKEHISDCISDNDYVLKYRPKLEPIFKKFGKKIHYGDFGKKHSCALNSGNSYIIDSNLDVYRCDNLIGNPKYSIGKIIDGVLHKTSEYYNQRTWSPFKFEKCKLCKRLPVCAASCAFLCLLKNGSMNVPTCYITEEQLIEKVKQYISR